MKHSSIIFQEPKIDSDNFAITSLLYRLQSGEEIDNEEFSFFVKMCEDLIRNMRLLVKKVG